jgi:hypothetical protein
MPAVIILPINSALSVLGPRVQIIFVFFIALFLLLAAAKMKINLSPDKTPV